MYRNYHYSPRFFDILRIYHNDFGSLVELYDAIAFALRSGAIGFQLIGILYLLSS